MKLITYGSELLNSVVVEKIPSEKINIDGLINMFESNLDKVATNEWIEMYQRITPIYKTAFTYGELPESMLAELTHELIEIAEENIGEELSVLLNKATPSNGKDYYYEFARSLGVEIQASKLKEHLDEDCDFV